MPTVSRFFGIRITMYYGDHAPPHFHAQYAEHTASLTIAELQVLEGSLPRRAHALVLEWAALHRDELAENWDLARSGRPLQRIEPLE